MSSVTRQITDNAASRASTLPRLGRVIAHIDANLSERVRLADLAAVACTSRYHFCRRFRCAMGVSPHRFVTQRRIARAKELLEFSDLALSRIAREVGFNSTRQFAARFRELCGISPGTFRKLRAQD